MPRCSPQPPGARLTALGVGGQQRHQLRGPPDELGNAARGPRRWRWVDPGTCSTSTLPVRSRAARIPAGVPSEDRGPPVDSLLTTRSRSTRRGSAASGGKGAGGIRRGYLGYRPRTRTPGYQACTVQPCWWSRPQHTTAVCCGRPNGGFASRRAWRGCPVARVRSPDGEDGPSLPIRPWLAEVPWKPCIRRSPARHKGPPGRAQTGPAAQKGRSRPRWADVHTR